MSISLVRPKRLRSSERLSTQLTANQLVQSHTPIAELAHSYADKDVLVIGGVGDDVRQVALS